MPRRLSLLAAPLLVGLALASCGGDETAQPAGGADPAAQGSATRPAPQVDFPRRTTLKRLLDGVSEGAVLAPSTALIDVGRNRFGFALFDESREQVVPDAVAIYVSKPDGTRLRGPFVARSESLAVRPQFQSRQTQADLEDIDAFFVADVDVPAKGKGIFTALASVDGRMVATSSVELPVGRFGGPPEIGDPAIPIDTETPADVGGDLAQIDTRLPPLPELHDVNFADVLGRRPAVLVFATPQLCQVRVCGPVVDVAAEVASRTEGVEFVHQEIYNGNDLQQGFRQQVLDWRLPTEPWVFVISGSGRVVDRFEGAVSVAELERGVAKVGTVG